MKKRLALCCLGLFALSSLIGRGANSGDRFAWEVLVDISRPQANGASGAESPIAWRLWSTQREVFSKASEGLMPASTGHYEEIRRLKCELLRQESKFPLRPAEVDEQCEVVFLNDSAAKYILEGRMYLRSLLAAAAEVPGIHLPMAARELKTEWRRIEPRQFADYIVAIDDKNKPWGLVALHLMTHEQPRWFWATWIHKEYASRADLRDNFGAAENGGTSEALGHMLDSNNERYLSNYKLIGSQTEFQPVMLSNPLIEVGVQCSSCMGCHQSAGLRRDGTWSLPNTCRTLGEAKRPPDGMNLTDFDFTLAGQAKCHNARGCKDAL